MSVSAHAHFRRVDAVFDAVLDLPSEEQEAYIHHACGDDDQLRTQVLQLLRAHNRTGSILDTPATPLAPLLFDGSAMAVGADQRIGPFRVVRAIGHGGMGQVLLGERADAQFTQRVAIKLIRHPAPGLIRRFLEERRIVASLEHPHIARLIDGGITNDGLPYFAMEYVEGEPIDRYCEARALSLDQRLALFEQVCDAVACAHRHLIIHRDLKPSNILVTASGDAKLLDFGIAKLLDAGGAHASLEETATGFRVMTPDVAAPEQVLGDPVSTATDVYALGLLLYQLLTTQRPYDVRGKPPAVVQRIVCDFEPPPPSTRVEASLRRRVRGDLDLIVMTALQKAPQRRYQSPATLAEDVRRFREGRAILARPDSARYRLRKFVARHRAGVALAAVLAVAVVGAGARERILRQRAQVEAQKAKEVEDFLVRVFDVADPFAVSDPDGGTITARQLLERGAQRIDSTLTGQPEVQAELRAVLGRVYSNLGLFDKATPLLEQSLAQRVALSGEQGADVAATMDLLGTALTRLDRYDAAEPLLRRALQQRRRLLGSNDSATAASIQHLATLLEERGQNVAAESLHREVLVIRQKLFGDSAVEVANSLNDLALVRYRRGGYDEAVTLFRRALAIDQRHLGAQHPLTAATMQNLAMTLQLRGDLAEAERYYRQSLDAKRASLGDAHPSVTISLNNFGRFLAGTLGRLDEGEAMTRQAILLDRQIFGDRHSYVAEGLRNLGIIQRTRGDYAAADSSLTEALAIDRALLGERHQKIANIYGQLAQLRHLTGDMDAAVAFMRQSLSQYREFVGDDHLYTAMTRGNLARILAEHGSAVEAESLALAALARLDSASSAHRPHYINVRRTLGAALLAQGRVDAALVALEPALTMARAEFGDTDVRTALVQLTTANALAVTRQRPRAESLLRAAQATLATHRRDQPRLVSQVNVALTRLTVSGQR